MIVKDKKFYSLILSIGVPIAMQNLITFGVSMADSVMIGRLGETTLSAVTLANQLFFIFMITCFGIGSGANILISQYWGKGDKEAIHRVMSIMYKISAVAAVISMITAFFFPRQFMLIFTQDETTVQLGIEYLRIIYVSYIFFAITNATINALRSVQTVKISVVVYSVSLVVNICLNWVLIFGKLGAPALGIRGGAIATVIARITEFIIVMIFMLFMEKKIHFKAKALLKMDKVLLLDYVKVGGPVLGNELIWALGSSALAFIIAKLGNEAVAANSIYGIVYQFTSIFIMGAGNAAAVIIGNIVGEGKYDMAKAYTKKLTLIAIILGIAGGLITLLIRPYVIMMYGNVSDLTKDIAMQMMAVGAGIFVFQSLGFILMIGVLRGGGDTHFVFLADVSFLWLIAIPLGYIAGVVLKWPILPTYLILRCDEILKVIVSWIRIKQDKWIKNVTRDTY